MKISLYKMGDLKELIIESDEIISPKIRDCYMAVYRGESEGDELKVLVKNRKRLYNTWRRVRERYWKLIAYGKNNSDLIEKVRTEINGFM